MCPSAASTKTYATFERDCACSVTSHTGRLSSRDSAQVSSPYSSDAAVPDPRAASALCAATSDEIVGGDSGWRFSKVAPFERKKSSTLRVTGMAVPAVEAVGGPRRAPHVIIVRARTIAAAPRPVVSSCGGSVFLAYRRSRHPLSARARMDLLMARSQTFRQL